MPKALKDGLLEPEVAGPFYSALRRQIAARPGVSQSPVGWLQTISAWVNAGKVKRDEVEWSGLVDWISLCAGKISKDDVLSYLDANGVRVTETVLGEKDKAGEWEKTGNGWRRRLGNRWTHISELSSGDIIGVGPSKYRQRFSTVDDAKAYYDGLDRSAASLPAKYGQHALAGGSNYRELLLTLPGETADQQLQRWMQKYPDWREGQSYKSVMTEADQARFMAELDGTKKDYRSSHWNQPNVLAHIRVTDRADAEGKKVLFVEEIQSDWGQQGREQGFGMLASVADTMRQGGFMPDEWERMSPERRMLHRRQVASFGFNSAVPAAPFVDSTDKWLTLALKRIVKMAVDGGYDQVAFITGEQIAELMSVDKRLSKLSYEPAGEGLYEILGVDREGGEVVSEDDVTIARVEELFGKVIAEKIANGEGEKGTNGGYRDWRTFSGDGLKIESRGMRVFYDQIVPNAVNALLWKLGGARLGFVDLDVSALDLFSQDAGEHAREYWDFSISAWDRLPRQNQLQLIREWAGAEKKSQPGFAITDSLREKVAGGLPLFSFAGERAKTADHGAMDAAARRLDQGEAPEQVRRGTGWFRGADGRLRFEIDDSQARARYRGTFGQAHVKALASAGEAGRVSEGAASVPLAELLHHPALFAAYPLLAQLSVIAMDGAEPARGRLLIDSRGPQAIGVRADVAFAHWPQVLIHEIQHAIQELEGFEGGVDGGAPGYRDAAGEVEARNVQARFNLSAAERAQIAPQQTQDVGVSVLSAGEHAHAGIAHDRGRGLLRVQRAQVGGDSLRASDGEAGFGVYAFFPRSSAMRRHYGAKGFNGAPATLWDIDLDASCVVDLTQAGNMRDLLAYARGQFSELAATMPGYIVPKVSAHTIQRFGRIIESFVRDRHGWAKAWIIGHYGVGIPHSRQIVIADDSAVVSARPRPSGRACVEREMQFSFPSLGVRDQTGFRRWSGGLDLVAEDVLDYGGGPAVFVAYHGTTHSDIERFDRRGEPEGFLGRGPYFTTSAKDASINYAGIGPDLAYRIDREVDSLLDQTAFDAVLLQFAQDKPELIDPDHLGLILSEAGVGDEDLMWRLYGQEAARHCAAKGLVGDSDGLVMKVLVRLRQPADIVGDQWLDAIFAEDGTLVGGACLGWLEAAKMVLGAEDFKKYQADVDQELYAEGAISMRKLFELTLGLDDWVDRDVGGGGAVFAAIAEQAGYDGIVMSAWEHFCAKGGSMDGVSKDTLHVVPFRSSQVKSFTGNNGRFDDASDDIRMSVAGGDVINAGETVRMSFAGPKARTADRHALEQAIWRSKVGEDKTIVWSTLGWMLGIDGKWRFEIDDSGARIDMRMLGNIDQGQVCKGMPEVARLTYRRCDKEGCGERYDVTLVPAQPRVLSDIASFVDLSADMVQELLGSDVLDQMRRQQGEDDLIGAMEPARGLAMHGQPFRGFDALPLDCVLHHPALFAAYPQLRNVLVCVDRDLPAAAAYCVQTCQSGESQFERRLIKLRRGRGNGAEILGQLMHEVQHAIQDIEGFAPGSSARAAAEHQNKLHFVMTEQALGKVRQCQALFPQTHEAFLAMQRHFYSCLAANGVDVFDEAGRSRDLMTLTRMLRLSETAEQAEQRSRLTQAYRGWMERETGAFASASNARWREAVQAITAAQMYVFEADGEVYRRMAGEVEARNVQHRLVLSSDERASMPPGQTQDVDDSMQLIDALQPMCDERA